MIKLPINYGEEKERITEFIKTFKGPVPSLRQHKASILQLEDDDEEADAFADDLDDMDIGTSSSPRSTSRSKKSGLKYMEQLQRIANRDQDSLVIDLNDVSKVSVTGMVSLIVKFD